MIFVILHNLMLDLADGLTGFSLHPQNQHINDLGLPALVELKYLRHLSLSRTSVTHKGLEFVKGISLPYIKHQQLFIKRPSSINHPSPIIHQ